MSEKAEQLNSGVTAAEGALLQLTVAMKERSIACINPNDPFSFSVMVDEQGYRHLHIVAKEDVRVIYDGVIYDLNGDTAYAGQFINETIIGIESRPVYRFFKRAADIVFSAGVLVLFSWLFLIIAALIKIDDPKGPVFFSQTRVGKNGKPFKMYKFRSMCVDAEDRLEELLSMNEKTGPVFKIARDPRITRVGYWLRKLSLDELPQFWNVIKGDISVVGPRPALPKEVETYNDYQRQRLLVRPGITCYWQTRRNRDSVTFDEWVDLDLLYIKQCGLWADFKLVIQTIGVVLTAQGS